MSRRLLRSNDKIIAGVCGGFANYIGFEPTFIRIIFLMLALLGGTGLVLYAVLWILLPNR